MNFNSTNYENFMFIQSPRGTVSVTSSFPGGSYWVEFNLRTVLEDRVSINILCFSSSSVIFLDLQIETWYLRNIEPNSVKSYLEVMKFSQSRDNDACEMMITWDSMCLVTGNLTLTSDLVIFRFKHRWKLERLQLSFPLFWGLINKNYINCVL